MRDFALRWGDCMTKAIPGYLVKKRRADVGCSWTSHMGLMREHSKLETWEGRILVQVYDALEYSHLEKSIAYMLHPYHNNNYYNCNILLVIAALKMYN